jgi:hypothetical protein
MTPSTVIETEEFPLRQPRGPAHDVQDADDVEQTVGVTDPRHTDSQRTKLSVLIGSGILQLPIWGMDSSQALTSISTHPEQGSP